MPNQDACDFLELSRQLRDMRRRLSLTRIYIGVLTLGFGSVFLMGQTAIRPGEVDVNRIRFVTRDGALVAALSVEESRFRAGNLVLKDDSGTVRVSLGELGDSSPAATRLSLHDGKGESRVNLMAFPDTALLQLREAATQPVGVVSDDRGRRLELEVIKGVPRLALFDEKATLRVLVGGTDGTDYSNASAKSVGSLVILDSQGNAAPVWKAP